MPNYDFTVTFNLPDSEPHPSHYVDILHVNGCDDALVGVGRLGKIALNFTRDASSATEAVYSAIADVKQAIPEAKLIEVSPDLTSITDVAKRLGCTRQNIRNLLMTGGANSPNPVYNGTPSIWHLSDILTWLVQEKHYKVDSELLELAQVNRDLNTIREWQRVDVERQRELESLFTRLLPA
ncbi:DNA-binding protein [Geitlerinema sp. P-1104]|uniref:helix-turn-helix transcriptional regulator n=1 Tax=Geitlerinema sp. P-1104 TaxID=2546230 RepID=UPI00147774FC|nr:DNA-binding protein [Geitlerinema sp. P-1104]NMG60831.1 DNA-binding protein [Geitlerinema sp. P-1104]